MGEFLGIALVFVMIVAMLDGLDGFASQSQKPVELVPIESLDY